jgi:hypothetical protein
MYVKISDIVFKEILPMGAKKTVFNMGFYYYSEWKRKRREEKAAEEAENQEGDK